MINKNYVNHDDVTKLSLTILGIDPGVKGGIALLSLERGLIEVLDMPSAVVRVGKGNKTRILPAELARYLARHSPAHAYVEAVHAMPSQGVSSTFAFGQALGQVEGVLAALGVPVSYVTPQAWKRALQVKADKGTSRQRAMQLWPALAGSFARVRDDGRAEAALIGLYGLRLSAVERYVEAAAPMTPMAPMGAL